MRKDNLEFLKRSVLELCNFAQAEFGYKFTKSNDNIISENEELKKWLEPYNEFINIHKTIKSKKKLRQKLLELTIRLMIKNDYTKYCGFPVRNDYHVYLPSIETGDKSLYAYYSKIVNLLDNLDDDSYTMIYVLKYLYKTNTGKQDWINTGKFISDYEEKDCKVTTSNYWFSHKSRKHITTYNVKTPGGNKAIALIKSIDQNYNKFDLLVDTHYASDTFNIKQEKLATKKLKSMLSTKQYNKYVITGSFIERSKRSSVDYLLRKLKPTIAFRNCEFLAGLCLHPTGYYNGTFSGCLCPTDDVISHLLWIRGDEKKFWAKANHHTLNEVEIGVP